MKKKLKKPIKIVGDPYWDWTEINKYIEDKYEIDTHVLWKYLQETSWADEFNNGSYQYLYLAEDINDPETPDDIKEILQLFLDEFHEDQMYCYICW